MCLQGELLKQMNQAVKDGDKLKLSTIRLVRAAVKNKEIELRRELRDEDVVQVISTLIRQRLESIEQFKKGGRNDLVDKEEKELSILRSFMPPQLSREEIKGLVQQVVKELQATGAKDMGRVMKEVIPRVAGRADNRVVSEVVREVLVSERI